MTENISYGDVIALQDMHHGKSGSNTLATVIGVSAALIVLFLIWGIYSRRRDEFVGSEKNTNIELGELAAGMRYQGAILNDVCKWERQDALSNARTEVLLHGYNGYAPYGYANGCGGHRECGCTKSKFQEVKSFTPDTDVVTLTTTC